MHKVRLCRANWENGHFLIKEIRVSYRKTKQIVFLACMKMWTEIHTHHKRLYLQQNLPSHTTAVCKEDDFFLCSTLSTSERMG